MVTTSLGLLEFFISISRSLHFSAQPRRARIQATPLRSKALPLPNRRYLSARWKPYCVPVLPGALVGQAEYGDPHITGCGCLAMCRGKHAFVLFPRQASTPSL